MKFLAHKGAPDIPLELIEAQESGTLVFFCGAGISYPAGLPSFSGLVDQVYNGLGEQRKPLEEEAIKAGLYDRALTLLEARMVRQDSGVNLVRKEIIQQLSILQGSNLETHKSVLQLSKIANQKFRVVTTNVDHGFLLADSTIANLIDAAPKLPVPKPHKWSSVVHLHGIINKADTNGENLVFTSGDFGSAYLTERWASKFVTELFSHFTVLFVGYSVNDPVIRYMTDAIAAERRLGYEKFNKPFVIANTKTSTEIADKNVWLAKGVEPILYKTRGQNHSSLHKTLKAWADYSRDGLNAKARIVRKEATIAPLPPYDQDESVKRLMDVLREKTTPNDDKVSGYPAKVFRNLDKPPAPIEWLQVLSDEGLLFIAQKNSKVHPVSVSPYEANLLRPNKITLHLWWWLLYHLESDVLVSWIIDNGVCLHPQLKQIIKLEIEKKPPQQPYMQFWKIITSSYVRCGRSTGSKGYEHIKPFKGDFDDLDKAELTNLLEPSLKITKSIYWPSNLDDDTENKKRPPYNIEVVIGISKWTYGELKKTEAYPKELTELLLSSTQSLKKALDLLAFIGPATEKTDRSYWDLVSISPHSQNTLYHNWVVLIEICRDSWEASWESNKILAKTIFDLWHSLNYPTFRRLSFHVITETDILPTGQKLDYLLEESAWWLWAIETKREVFRLLAKLWPILNNNDSERLLAAILKGPPRKMYSDDLTEDEWKDRFDRHVWLKLAKLESFGKELSEFASECLVTLKENHPEWALQEDERDEFAHWHETRSGNKVDISLEELFSEDAPEIVEFLSQESPEYGEGRIDRFRVGCKDNRAKAVEVLQLLTRERNWHRGIWHASLVGLADNEENSWADVAPLLAEVNPDLYREEAWAIAWWTRKTLASIDTGSVNEDYFWVILNSILTHSQDDEGPGDSRDAVGYAINHPIGIISEALMDRFGERQIRGGEGIPDGPLRESVNQLAQSPTQVLLAGKIILASRLSYLHAIDPQWTQENLVPLFDWSRPELAALMWKGYLWSPRTSIDLASELKANLLIALNHTEQLGDSGDQLIQLFTFVCLEYQNLYNARQQRDALGSLGAEGLPHVAEHFWRSVSGDPESSDTFWRNRIHPFMKKAWPKAVEFISEKSSEYLALMVIELNEAYKEGVDFLTPLIRPIDDLYLLLSQLQEKSLPELQPRQTLRLLSTVFTEEYQHPDQAFRDILERLILADPTIAEDTIFRRMNHYLIQNGL